MSSIVTFYSFKGGVGRSMALANIAVLLARRGKRVLAVDWDLEAPGLERYFDYFDVTPTSGGLLPFLVEQDARLAANAEANPQRYREHLWTIKLDDSEHPISLFTSGRVSHDGYVGMLERFEWDTFFARGGGDFLERLRELWRKDFDIVLVDSRTGMNDMGGICTIQIPDVLVVLFTANYQSVQGVRDVIEWAQVGRQRLAYDRMPLTILPIPSRFPTGGDFKTAQEWLDRFAQMLGECFGTWLPRWVAPRATLERLKLPHHDAFAFGERLAVVEQGVVDPASLGFAYDRICDLLATDFSDIEAALGNIARASAETPRAPLRGPDLSQSKPRDGEYRYDVFVSYARSGGVLDEEISRFVLEVAKQTEKKLGRRLEIFDVDVESRPWGQPTIEKALEQSRVLLVLLTPQYFTSEWRMRELQTFEAGGRSIVPIILRQFVSVSGRFIDHHMLNAADWFARPNSRSLDFVKLIDDASNAIAGAIQAAPSPHTMRATVKSDARQTSILFIAANPVGMSDLRLAVEAREIENELGLARYRNSFALHTRLAVRPLDLVRALDRYKPTIVHYSGHGNSDGIFLEGDDERPLLMDTDELVDIFRTAGGSVRLVVLNTNNSTIHSERLAEHVDCVIGMASVISDSASRRFAVGLYRALANGHSVGESFEMAALEMSLMEPSLRLVPRIRSVRRGVDPTKMYFHTS